MTDGLLVTKYIIELLSNNEQLTNILSNEKTGLRIYPIDTKVDVNFPFVVLTRQNLTSEYCKDGRYRDNVQLSVIIVSNKYDESVNVAQLVRETIDNKSVKSDNVIIKQIRLVSANEDIFYDSYVQQLTFEIVF